MSQEVKQIRIQQKVDSQFNWKQNNPRLENKEIGYERETGRYKIGDGIHNWNDLPFAEFGGGVGQKTKDGGEIFNDYENNKAVSEYSHASGSNTHAGHFAFSFKEHEYTEADYDTTNNIGKYYLNTVEGIAAGLNYTIVLNNNFGYQGVVNSVGEDYIEVTNYLVPNSDSTKTIYYDSSYIIFPDKPAIQGDMLIGYAANSEGYNTNAMGKSSHAEGNSTISSGKYSHAEGKGSKAGGYASHAETSGQALGHGSHAEGGNTKATGAYSHAEGSYTNATGLTSHAEGESCLAAGIGSHAEGIFAKAHGEAQHVQGRYNIEDYNNKYAHIVGNGTSVIGEDGKEIRTLSNAHTLDWEGNAWFAGSVAIGDNSDILATERYVDNLVDNITPQSIGAITIGDITPESIGAAQIATGSYYGTGVDTYDNSTDEEKDSNAIAIALKFTPNVILIFGVSSRDLWIINCAQLKTVTGQWSNNASFLPTNIVNSEYYYFLAKLEGTTVYFTGITSHCPNRSGSKYYWIAL